MSEFLSHTMNDIRAGRDSWRVTAMLCTIALTITLTVQQFA